MEASLLPVSNIVYKWRPWSRRQAVGVKSYLSLYLSIVERMMQKYLFSRHKTEKISQNGVAMSL